MHSKMDAAGLALYDAARAASAIRENMSASMGHTVTEYRDAKRAEDAAWRAYNAHLVARLQKKGD